MMISNFAQSDSQDTKHCENQVRFFKTVIPDASQIFEQLQKLPWQEVIWGKTGRKLPRLCMGGVEGTKAGRMIQKWVQDFFLETMNIRCDVMGIFGNHYRTGNDWLPDHKDSYDSNGVKLHVVSLSFGATRNFRFIGGGSNKDHTFQLSEGDIIIFSPEQNLKAKHGIPKQPAVKQARINLTCFCIFRGDPYNSEFVSALVPPIPWETLF